MSEFYVHTDRGRMCIAAESQVQANEIARKDGHTLVWPPKGCARRACQARLVPGQTFFNRSTRELYCQTCAVKLNRHNEADALRLYNGPLCITVEEAKAKGEYSE